MAERARDLGGDFTISPEPSGGSLLVWQVPAQRSPTAGMTDATGPPVRRVLLRAG